MGRLLTVRNASRQPGGFIRGGRIVTGGVTDMFTQLVEGAKPKQVDCPWKKK